MTRGTKATAYHPAGNALYIQHGQALHNVAMSSFAGFCLRLRLAAEVQVCMQFRRESFVAFCILFRCSSRVCRILCVRLAEISENVWRR